MEKLCKRLARAKMKAVEWRERNYVAFDNSKNKMIMFTRGRNLDLRKLLAQPRITIKRHNMRFNFKATKWLGMYLDIGLQFCAHKNISLENAKYVEDRVHRLGSVQGLKPGPIRQGHLATLQEVALYSAEI